jgi:Replication-relaxation
MRVSTPPPRPAPRLLAELGHLGPRDRLLLRLLADHQVLTTGQVHALLFGSLRRAQRRLAVLHRAGFLSRFRDRQGRGGSQPWRWTLGPLGLALDAAARGHPPPTPRQVQAHQHAIAANPCLDHLLGVNQFFVDLAAHARTHPGARLARWWSERQATALFRGVHPDGHGLWQAAGRTVGFFLEHDTGTENRPRVIGKLAAYDKLARAGGPAYPVLFWLHSPDREAHLRQALAGLPAPRCPAATAVRAAPGANGAPAAGPAGAVWALAADPGCSRLALHQLPGADHGQNTPINPNWADGRLTLHNPDSPDPLALPEDL